jgi:hypothetical protein
MVLHSTHSIAALSPRYHLHPSTTPTSYPPAQPHIYPRVHQITPPLPRPTAPQTWPTLAVLIHRRRFCPPLQLPPQPLHPPTTTPPSSSQHTPYPKHNSVLNATLPSLALPTLSATSTQSIYVYDTIAKCLDVGIMQGRDTVGGRS